MEGIAMLKLIAKLLKVLNSDNDPNQISLALCFSMVVGLTPFISLHNLFVLLLVLVVRVNLSAFLLGLVSFSGISYMLDPLFHRVGITALKVQSIEAFWIRLYNSPLWRLENFNNSIVMGSVLVSLVFFIPLHLLVKHIIRRYREGLRQWVENTRVMQIMKASKLYNIYVSITG